MEKPRVLQMTTHAASANLFMAGQLRFLAEEGFEMAVAASPGAALEVLRDRERVTTFSIPMRREISPWRDQQSLRETLRVIHAFRPHIVNAGTPKAGLLGMLAARIARVPVRIYTLRGLRLETAAAPKRQLLEWTEKIAAGCAHTVVCVSPSLRSQIEELRLAAPEKLQILANGSSNGVHADRFFPSATKLHLAEQLAQKLNLPGPQSVTGTGQTIGFVGRLSRDKGIIELAEAFFRLQEQTPQLKLLLVGDFETGDAVPTAIRNRLLSSPHVVITGFVSDPAPYYHLMGQLVLPSLREGFPNVPLEAAAAGLPVVAFDATGSRDAVVDRVTGTLIPLGDVQQLATAMYAYLASPGLRKQHGFAGQQRAVRDFHPTTIWNALAALYRQRLRNTFGPGTLDNKSRDRLAA